MQAEQLDLFALPPDATLIAGPVGCGKTEHALDEVLRARTFGPAFGTIWVLLATGLQRNAFRERLVARSPDAVQFGVEIFDFYTLYSRLLDLAGDPQRQVDDSARHHVLRAVAEDLRDRDGLEVFGGIAHLPGFVSEIGSLISELKQGLVTPEAFADVTGTRPARDRDLGRIYAAYQDFLLRHRLVDRHGAGWLALAHVERDPQLAAHVGLLVVDGFDQFNALHARLVSALARQVKRTVLTLTHTTPAPGRHFARIERTWQRMAEAVPDLWQHESLDGCGLERPPALDHLMESLFRMRPGCVPGQGAVRLIEAPDRAREVQLVLRRVKRLLLDGGEPDAVAVVARDMARYGGALRETARAYGIPLVVREETPLRENPAVAAVLELIALAEAGFPRRETVDSLRSPYLAAPDLDAGQIALAERISLRQVVVRGRETWLDAIETASTAAPDEDGEAPDQPDPLAAGRLAEALARHFDRITPPARGTVRALAGWIMALIGPDPAQDEEDGAEGEDAALPGAAPRGDRDHFDVLACVRATPDAERSARDVAALGVLRDVLAGIGAAHDLVDGDADPAVLAWRAFRAELDLAIQGTTVTPTGGLSRLGRVLATDVFELRGLPHEHVFLLGMAQGEFPAPVADGALIQESERADLAGQGIALPLAAERADDMSLFYQVVGQARATLTLSRATVDDRGALLEPSPYWRAVCAAVDVPEADIERMPVGAAPALAEAATVGEAAVAVSAVFSGERADDPHVPARGVYNALLDRPAWRGALRGRAVEAGREDGARPFDGYGGILDGMDLRAAVRERLGPGRIWSASQLNEIGQCPYRFFARRLLKLEELKEPEEGLDVLQRGLVNHAILEEAYRRIGAEGLTIEPENAGRARVILDEAATDIFRTAPQDYGFRPGPVWAQERAEMQRRLRTVVALDFSGAGPLDELAGGAMRTPYAQEVAFGPEVGLPVVLDGPAGRLRVRGMIDRIDVAGNRVWVVDYKTGSTPRKVEDMRAGREVQMVLYLIAAQELLRARGEPLDVGGGVFWHLQNATASGALAATDGALLEAVEHVHAHVGSARAGRFPVRPAKVADGRCTTYCEFGRLCRLSRSTLRKPGAGGIDVVDGGDE